MKTSQNKVAEMMRVYQQETPVEMTTPSIAVRELRAKLSFEETLEKIVEGLGVESVWSDRGEVWNLREMLARVRARGGRAEIQFCADGVFNMQLLRDGIADTSVVNLGDAVACGINAEEDFNEVMRSNMSKLWTDSEVADLSMFYTTLRTSGFPIGEVLEIGPEKEFKATKVNDSSRCWLVKDASGKAKKSPSYSPANLL